MSVILSSHQQNPRSDEFLFDILNGMEEPNNRDIPRNSMRLEGEEDRSPEYKKTRNNLVVSIKDLLDDAEGRMARGEALGVHGTIMNKKGIVRTIIQDPSANARVNLMTEATEPLGVYFHHDTETGQRSLVVVEPDKVTEVVDNPLEQQVAGPEAGYTGASSSLLASFNERLPDGSYVGASVVSSGGFSIRKFDGGNHIGISLSHNPEQLELVGTLWEQAQTGIIGDS